MSQSRAMDIGNTGVGENGVNNIKRDSSSSDIDDVVDHFEELEGIAELKNFDEIYGSTPPRTRIKNKNKSWDRKQKMENPTVKMRPGRLARSRADRRNTLDCAILNEMIIEPSIDDKARTDKRSIQLQRDYERDQKMNPQQRSSLSFSTSDEVVESTETVLQTEPKCIESSNRFMSVKSRPVGCRISAPPSTFAALTFPKISTSTDTGGPQTRREFHETFSNLIKLGSNDKQERNTRSVIITREEQIWQTEIKDMIWLELQANMADRTIEQQDKFLIAARHGIPELLREIMNYRFNRKYFRTDSGISSGLSTSTTSTIVTAETSRLQQNGFCFGCLSMYCKDCLDAQTIALRQVESLLTRLEAAEDLYPSNKVMGTYHVVYQSTEFLNRIKTLNQWYNITRHHRLKLVILGKLLAKLQGKEYKWPLVEAETSSSGSSSVQETENDSTRGSSAEYKGQDKLPREQFNNNVDETDHITASDSANSEESFKSTYNLEPKGEYGMLLHSLSSLKLDSVDSSPEKSASPYRKFIENVLKSRGLGKSLSFLHKLHNNVLRKAQIALEKPGTEDTEHELFADEISNIEVALNTDEIQELRRYGVWCDEYKQLSLPSYISAFLFLSVIPLEVVHEFLKMKLETKPMQPNPLSLEQLIKELKEGLTLALIHRDRYSKHISTALVDRESEGDMFLHFVDDFDRTLKQIFELYLEYVEQWILIGVPATHRKSALEDEWKFTKLTCPMINGEHKVAAKRFCDMIQNLIDAIGSNLIKKVKELENFSFEIPVKEMDEKTAVVINENSCTTVGFDEEVEEDPSTILKNQLLTMCREIQQLFTDERDKCVKLMTFTKTLFKDIEKEDFHRDHNSIDDSQVCLRHSSCMCTEVLETINALKRKMLLLREKLTSTLLKVQERSEVQYMIEMDENDRAIVLTRCREILHVGFKFGFEYHKNLSTLFESTTITNSRNSQTDSSLAKAIVGFAQCWMNFVMERCERGRGLRPRWAAQGLDFLIIACDPHNTEQIDEKEFEDLKSAMDKCISHVIGSIHEPERVKKSPRARKSSPAPSRKRTPTRSSFSHSPTAQRVIIQQLSVQVDRSRLTPSPSPNELPIDFLKKQISCENGEASVNIRVPGSPNSPSPYSPELRQIRIRDAVNRLDFSLENKLREKILIGNVKELNSCDKVVIRARSVHFSWHRGIKIGQGRFGKVYTAVNNSTGDLMAMKEIPIQAGETGTVKKVAEELKIFEGISHRHLVKYYGVEIHREELLIFMELCSEGSLESLCEISGGLHEALVRRFTTQLLLAVEELHKHGVVHRDIKCANIFLTNGGNCLKLGDFGSAAKITLHTTQQGELKGYVGTQAYMAPEVFTKTNTDGHGRAADIWSAGCCVIEMASGKRPWYQFDSNYQIMFKVGMGETPEIPSLLSDEGIEFVECCLVHDPKQRWTASELLQHHNFCKVVIGDECDNCEEKRTLKLDKGPA